MRALERLDEGMIKRPSGSTDGRTAAIRTPAGSVASKRLNSSVHENTRRSMSAFASCAAAAIAASRDWSTLRRAVAAFWRRSRAVRSAWSASAANPDCRRDSATRAETFSTVQTSTMIAATPRATVTARSL